MKRKREEERADKEFRGRRNVMLHIATNFLSSIS